MTTFTDGIATAEKVVETVSKIEPTVATVTGMFIPGAAPILALVQPWAPVALSFLEKALQDIASNNTTDLGGAFVELLQHISKGAPNSSALAPTSPAPTGPVTT